MTEPAAARSFLLGEVEALSPLEFVAVAPGGTPLHAVEITRGEGAGLEVRVPGRAPTAPELPVAVRGALHDRGFVSEAPAERTHPWVRGVPDAGAAVHALQDVLMAVFGEKPDVAIDVAHGSHRIEHEARRKLAIARERIESILTDMPRKRPEKDADGDYVLAVDDVHIVIAPRAALNGQIVVRVFAITNVGVEVTPDLGLFLARLNFGLMFGRFALDIEHRAIWFDETLLGEEFREEELRFAIQLVASTADTWDDRFEQMFGGARYQEVLAARSDAVPPTKPGQGVGQYL
jgi:hypothetical protein